MDSTELDEGDTLSRRDVVDEVVDAWVDRLSAAVDQGPADPVAAAHAVAALLAVKWRGR
jgi:predicted alpha/beta hydrolase family esterase